MNKQEQQRFISQATFCEDRQYNPNRYTTKYECRANGNEICCKTYCWKIRELIFV